MEEEENKENDVRQKIKKSRRKGLVIDNIREDKKEKVIH